MMHTSWVSGAVDGCRCLRRACPVTLALVLTAYGAHAATTALGERESHQVGLAKISVVTDDKGGSALVKVAREGVDGYAVVSSADDEDVRMTRRGRETTAYPESRTVSERLSSFEASVLREVTLTLVGTLDDLQDDLTRNRWGRVRYLDSYLLRFLRGYQVLLNAATCCQDALPRSARIPESAYDVSTMSPKTDARVRLWQSTPDHVVKLRICAKTLSTELQSWARASETDPQEQFSPRLKNAYQLFVQAYLGRQAPVDSRTAALQPR
jgi:hypothetical protein